jgi:hypothetical protein
LLSTRSMPWGQIKPHSLAPGLRVGRFHACSVPPVIFRKAASARVWWLAALV